MCYYCLTLTVVALKCDENNDKNIWRKTTIYWLSLLPLVLYTTVAFQKRPPTIFFIIIVSCRSLINVVNLVNELDINESMYNTIFTTETEPANKSCFLSGTQVPRSDFRFL